MFSMSGGRDTIRPSAKRETGEYGETAKWRVGDKLSLPTSFFISFILAY